MINQEWLNLILKLMKPNVRAYIVGGFVRDLLLGKIKTDIDITVTKDALALGKSLAQAIKGTYVLLDQDHGCARIVKKVNGVIYTIDISDFRAKTLEEDLGLRDFTLNSLVIPITAALNGQDLQPAIVDFNQGLKDLKLKKIRMNAPRVFTDDPLRLLRAFSLSAQHGFTIETKTLAQIKKDKALIVGVAAERVREEIFKILESPRTHEIVKLMDEIGFLEIIIPQLLVMKNVEQGGYHHLDVWQHSLLALKELEAIVLRYSADQRIKALLAQEIGGGHSRLSVLKFACLLHDIGKPQTKKWEGGRFTFHTHEHVGASIARHIAHQLRLTVKERYLLEDLVSMHLRPGYLSNTQKPSAKAMYRFLRDSKAEAVTLSLLAMADQAATCGEKTTKDKADHHQAVCDMILAAYFEPPKATVPKNRLVTGSDLIKTLKLKPSPLFAKILTAVDEAQALGKIKDKTEALSLARKLAKGKP